MQKFVILWYYLVKLVWIYIGSIGSFLWLLYWGASLAKWLKLLTSNHLLMWIPALVFGFVHVRTQLVSLWNIGGSAQKPVCAWNNTPAGLSWLDKLESRHMTSTVLVRHQTQLKKLLYRINQIYIIFPPQLSSSDVIIVVLMLSYRCNVHGSF